MKSVMNATHISKKTTYGKTVETGFCFFYNCGTAGLEVT